MNIAVSKQASGTIRPVQPFDFRKSLGFLGQFEPAHGEQAIAERSLTKAIMIDQTPVVFQVEASDADLRYTLFATKPLPAPVVLAIEDRIRFFLSTDDDLSVFYNVAESEPQFARVVKRLWGLHQVKFVTPFEIACWAVLTQRNPLPMARKMKHAIVDGWGATVQLDGVDYPAFPEAARLAQGGDVAITAAIGNKQTGAYVAAVSRAFASIDEAWLRAAPVEAVEAWLRGIPGIGPWSATFILIRGLGRTSTDPSSEKRLIDAASSLYGRPLQPADIESIASRYGSYRGYWAYYVRTAA